MKNDNRLIFKFAQGKKTILPKRSLIDMLKQSFKKHSSCLAVIYNDAKVNYQTLDYKSNAVASILQEYKIKKGDAVLVEMENSLELVVSLVGILKMGAIYIPIDPSWPIARRNEIYKIINPKIILVSNLEDIQNIDNIKKIDINYQTLSDNKKIFEILMLDQDAVYGFFTSGSTGIPKCALNTQIGLLNRLVYMNNRYGNNKKDVILHNSKNIFDSSLWQLLWPLMNGNLLIMPHNNLNFVPKELVKIIEKYQITVMDFVPSIFGYFVKFLQENKGVYKLKSLRQVLVGGEEMNAKDVLYFKNEFPHVGITNTYGPTECSIGTIFYEVSADIPGNIPIGKPIDNIVAIILKKNLQPVTIGEVGEIYLGGMCVGLGYLKNKRKTKQVFVKNHFSDLVSQKLYKTGDLGLYLPSGDIQYKGRVDQQVKINGVRVELGEIENKIKEIPGIDRVIVFFEGTECQKKELSVVVSVTNKKVNRLAITKWCQKTLPFSLVPNYVKIIDIFPLTSTGKINRKIVKDFIFK